MSARGVYRGVFSALPDDPEFQLLPPPARLTLYTVRLCREAGPAAIFRYYPGMLAAQTGLSLRALEGALRALEAGRWIERESVVLWVRNGLRYDPYVRLSDQKHHKGIVQWLAGLPKLRIVLRFCDYYQIPRPFEDPSETMRTGEGEGEGVGVGVGVGERTSSPLPPPLEGGRGGGGWGKPEDLVALYNAEAPDNVSAVEELSPKRRDKARKALGQYPAEAWWREVFVQYRRSRFLRGLTPPRPGHASFRPDFDWLLSVGKNGVENYVKVHDGMYAD